MPEVHVMTKASGLVFSKPTPGGPATDGSSDDDWMEAEISDGREDVRVEDERQGDLGGRVTWITVTRIGEAQNPGPAQVGPSIGEPARRVNLGPEGTVLQYPLPRERRSSMEVASPGFAAAAPAPCDKEKLQLVIETTNTTGWGQLKKRLEATTATVVLAQETWVLQSYVPAASAWARARGWRSVWAPATSTKKGGTSAGVAIFVRDFMGLHPKPGRAHIVHPSRVVAAILEAPGEREILLMSCYLKHGRKASGENARIRASIEGEVDAHGQDEVCIVGGDMNMEPQAMLATELDRNIGATLFYPPPPHPERHIPHSQDRVGARLLFRL